MNAVAKINRARRRAVSLATRYNAAYRKAFPNGVSVGTTELDKIGVELKEAIDQLRALESQETNK